MGSPIINPSGSTSGTRCTTVPRKPFASNIFLLSATLCIKVYLLACETGLPKIKSGAVCRVIAGIICYQKSHHLLRSDEAQCVLKPIEFNRRVSLKLSRHNFCPPFSSGTFKQIYCTTRQPRIHQLTFLNRIF